MSGARALRGLIARREAANTKGVSSGRAAATMKDGDMRMAAGTMSAGAMMTATGAESAIGAMSKGAMATYTKAGVMWNDSTATSNHGPGNLPTLVGDALACGAPILKSCGGQASAGTFNILEMLH